MGFAGWGSLSVGASRACDACGGSAINGTTINSADAFAIAEARMRKKLNPASTNPLHQKITSVERRGNFES